MASSGCSGLLMLKLPYAPGCEALICPGELTGPARIRRWLAKAGTVGLPAEAAPSMAVAAAAPEEKTTVGGVAYPAPGLVIATDVTVHPILRVAPVPVPDVEDWLEGTNGVGLPEFRLPVDRTVMPVITPAKTLFTAATRIITLPG